MKWKWKKHSIQKANIIKLGKNEKMIVMYCLPSTCDTLYIQISEDFESLKK